MAATAVIAVLATAYVMRAKGPMDVPGQASVIAEEVFREVAGKLADNFEDAGEGAQSKKGSRDFGESLKAANQKIVADGINSLGQLYKDAGIGFESGMSRKEDRWDPELAKEVSHEIAEGLRSLQ